MMNSGRQFTASSISGAQPLPSLANIREFFCCFSALLVLALKVPREYHSNPRDLLSRIQQQIKRPIPGERFPKIVIFTSFTVTCKEIAENLAKIFGKNAIASHETGKSAGEVEANVKRFKTQPHCFILVCDRSAEVGVNLQF